MYYRCGGSEKLGLLNLELADLLGCLNSSFDVPFVAFVQLFLLVTDDCVLFRDFSLEGRNGRVVTMDSGTEGGVLFFHGGSISVHIPQVEYPVF